MTERGLNPYHQPDVELAKQIIGTLRVAAQEVWDKRAWEDMMGEVQAARVPGEESRCGTFFPFIFSLLVPQVSVF